MRNMSFALTTRQFLDGTKTVTRRVEHRSKRNGELTGWSNLKPGEFFTAVEKAQGLKKGERINVLGQCRCISNESEPLDDIIRVPYRITFIRDTGTPNNNSVTGDNETTREGFPALPPEEFVEFFCAEMKCQPTDRVRRIEFVRV